MPWQKKCTEEKELDMGNMVEINIIKYCMLGIY